MIIKNGHVIDPVNGINGVMDIAVKDDKIIPIAEANPDDFNTIDAEGCFVTPGLIDHHCHLYPLAKIGLPAEAACFAAGVTTAVDAGSTGCGNLEQHIPFIAQAKLDIKAYLHVCTTGLASLPVLEDVNPAHWDEGAIRNSFDQYSDTLVGLKLRTSAPIVKEFGFKPLRAMVEMADRIGVSVMVHCTNPPGEMSELLSILRPGDIMTHMYMKDGSTIVENGKVKDCVWKARERGVLFETADARAHFGMPVAQTAIAEGFLPDIIATDLTKLSMHLRPTAFNMAMQISKYTALGIPFEKVIELATIAPAKQMGIADKAGSLTLGHPADIAVFRPFKKKNAFGDRPYGSDIQVLMDGDTVFQPVLTVKNGEMVYRDVTF